MHYRFLSAPLPEQDISLFATEHVLEKRAMFPSPLLFFHTYMRARMVTPKSNRVSEEGAVVTITTVDFARRWHRDESLTHSSWGMREKSNTRGDLVRIRLMIGCRTLTDFPGIQRWSHDRRTRDRTKLRLLLKGRKAVQ